MNFVHGTWTYWMKWVWSHQQKSGWILHAWHCIITQKGGWMPHAWHVQSFQGSIAEYTFITVPFHAHTVQMHPFITISTANPLILEFIFNKVVFILPETHRTNILLFTASITSSWDSQHVRLILLILLLWSCRALLLSCFPPLFCCFSLQTNLVSLSSLPFPPSAFLLALLLPFVPFPQLFAAFPLPSS